MGEAIEIPRVQTNLELMRSVCERIRTKSMEDVAVELKKSKVTIRLYVRSLERFGLLRKNGNGYELLKAGEEFLRLSRDKSLGDALFEAIVKFGDPSDIVTALKAYASGQLGKLKNNRKYRDLAYRWMAFLKHLGLISSEGLTQRGEMLLRDNYIDKIICSLRRKPKLLARKALWCAGFEFRKEDDSIVIRTLKHNVGLKLVLDELERLGYRIIKLDSSIGLPDAVLEKDGVTFVHEHKSKEELDDVDILQGYIYVLNIKDMPNRRDIANREIKLIFSNGRRKIRVYDVDEKLLEDIRQLIQKTAERLISNRFSPGRYCSFCGNRKCPYNRLN